MSSGTEDPEGHNHVVCCTLTDRCSSKSGFKTFSLRCFGRVAKELTAALDGAPFESGDLVEIRTTLKSITFGDKLFSDREALPDGNLPEFRPFCTVTLGIDEDVSGKNGTKLVIHRIGPTGQKVVSPKTTRQENPSVKTIPAPAAAAAVNGRTAPQPAAPSTSAKTGANAVSKVYSGLKNCQSQQERFNVYAVVASLSRLPGPTRGHMMMSQVYITDPTYSSGLPDHPDFQFSILCKNYDEFPKGVEVGSVLRIHNMVLQRWNGAWNGRVYSGNCVTVMSNGLDPADQSEGPQNNDPEISATERAKVEELHRWWRDKVSVGSTPLGNLKQLDAIMDAESEEDDDANAAPSGLLLRQGSRATSSVCRIVEVLPVAQKSNLRVLRVTDDSVSTLPLAAYEGANAVGIRPPGSNLFDVFVTGSFLGKRISRVKEGRKVRLHGIACLSLTRDTLTWLGLERSAATAGSACVLQLSLGTGNGAILLEETDHNHTAGEDDTEDSELDRHIMDICGNGTEHGKPKKITAAEVPRVDPDDDMDSMLSCPIFPANNQHLSLVSDHGTQSPETESSDRPGEGTDRIGLRRGRSAAARPTLRIELAPDFHDDSMVGSVLQVLDVSISSSVPHLHTIRAFPEILVWQVCTKCRGLCRPRKRPLRSTTSETGSEEKCACSSTAHLRPFFNMQLLLRDRRGLWRLPREFMQLEGHVAERFFGVTISEYMSTNSNTLTEARAKVCAALRNAALSNQGEKTLGVTFAVVKVSGSTKFMINELVMKP